MADKDPVDNFLRDAVGIFETAYAAPGEESLAILVDPSGVLRIVQSEGWSLEGMQAHYGAEAVYQVARSCQGVRVSGRSAGRSCILRWEPPAGLVNKRTIAAVLDPRG